MFACVVANDFYVQRKPPPLAIIGLFTLCPRHVGHELAAGRPVGRHDGHGECACADPQTAGGGASRARKRARLRLA